MTAQWLSACEVICVQQDSQTTTCGNTYTSGQWIKTLFHSWSWDISLWSNDILIHYFLSMVWQHAFSFMIFQPSWSDNIISIHGLYTYFSIHDRTIYFTDNMLFHLWSYKNTLPFMNIHTFPFMVWQHALIFLILQHTFPFMVWQHIYKLATYS